MVKGQLIDLVPRIRERAFERVVSEIGDCYAQAGKVIQEYLSLMQENPIAAINQMPAYFKRIEQTSPEPAYARIDPNPDFNGPLINILSTVYPVLERDARQVGLTKVLNFLDGIRSDYAQMHLEKVQEPWLFVDVLVNRWHYFPGCVEYRDLTHKCQNWEEFKLHLPPQNVFLLAFSVLHTNWDHGSGTNLPIRNRFYHEFPELTDRTLDAIAAICYETAKWQEQNKGLNFKTELEHQLDYYDSNHHGSLQNKIKEHKWIKLC